MGRLKGFTSERRGTSKYADVCLVEGCEKVRGSAKGYCPMHYSRWNRYGNTSFKLKPGSHVRRGNINNEGYRVIGINGKTIRANRLVMGFHLGRMLGPDEIVDHRNGKRSDDRLENLRLSTPKLNAENKHHCPTCTCPEEE